MRDQPCPCQILSRVEFPVVVTGREKVKAKVQGMEKGMEKAEVKVQGREKVMVRGLEQEERPLACT